MVRNYKPKPKPYNDQTLKLALQEIKQGAKVRPTSKKYNIGYGKLWDEYHAWQEAPGEAEPHPQLTRGKKGRKIALGEDVEQQIVRCIKVMEQMGMPPPIAELRDMVHDYLEANQLSSPFHENLPGRDWVSNFLQRHGLSLKKGGMMQLARKSVTSDPFVVFGFYDLLERIIEEKGLAEKPGAIYNMDETGFPTDPSKAKTMVQIEASRREVNVC